MMGEKVKDYLNLVGKVMQLDVEAAIYMTMVAPLQEGKGFEYHGELDAIFIWDDTPQGTSYWDSLYKQLNGFAIGEEFND